jgi:hypothetical protein
MNPDARHTAFAVHQVSGSCFMIWVTLDSRRILRLADEAPIEGPPGPGCLLAKPGPAARGASPPPCFEKAGE